MQPQRGEGVQLRGCHGQEDHAGHPTTQEHNSFTFYSTAATF